MQERGKEKREGGKTSEDHFLLDPVKSLVFSVPTPKWTKLGFGQLTMSKDKQTFSSDTVWEQLAGFSRAIRIGDQIHVSGTTATDDNGQLVGSDDPAAQTHFILDKIEAAIRQLGGRPEDIYRTRIYVGDRDIWEQVARVHGERFGDIRPANTLVEAGIIGDGYLVEIEADALIR